MDYSARGVMGRVKGIHNFQRDPLDPDHLLFKKSNWSRKYKCSDWVRVRYFFRPLSWRVFHLPFSLSRSPVWTVLFPALLWAFFIKRQAWDSIQNQRHRDDHIFSRQRSEPGCTDACVLLFSGRQNTEWKRLVCDKFLITKSNGPIKTRSKYL